MKPSAMVLARALVLDIDPQQTKHLLRSSLLIWAMLSRMREIRGVFKDSRICGASLHESKLRIVHLL